MKHMRQFGMLWLWITALSVLTACSTFRSGRAEASNRESPVAAAAARTIATVYQGPVAFPGDPEASEKIAWIAAHHDVVVTRAALPREIRRLKSHRPDLLVLQYLNIKGVHQNYPLDRPFYEAVRKANLFWPTSGGELVRNKYYNWFMVDIRDPQWPQALIEVLTSGDARYNVAGYDGLMFDDTMIAWSPAMTGTPDGYTPAVAYRAFGTTLSAVHKRFPQKTIVFNGYRYQEAAGDRSKPMNGIDLLRFADGISFETFTRRLNGRDYTKQRIRDQIHDFRHATTALNRKAFFIDAGKHDDAEKRLMSLATYLLLANRNTYYKYVATDIESPLQTFPEYHLDMGQPLSDFSETDAVFTREFENGLVIVNLATRSYYWAARGGFLRLDVSGGGERNRSGRLKGVYVADRLKVPSKSAVILVRRPAP